MRQRTKLTAANRTGRQKKKQERNYAVNGNERQQSNASVIQSCTYYCLGFCFYGFWMTFVVSCDDIFIIISFPNLLINHLRFLSLSILSISAACSLCRATIRKCIVLINFPFDADIHRHIIYHTNLHTRATRTHMLYEFEYRKMIFTNSQYNNSHFEQHAHDD